MANYRATYTAAEKRLFAERLKKAMLDKGLKGAELARQIGQKLGRPISKQSVSTWLSGMSVPEEATMPALEKILEMTPGVLLPRPYRVAPWEKPSPIDIPEQDVRMALVGGDKMRLTLAVEVPQAIGWEILGLLKQAGH